MNPAEDVNSELASFREQWRAEVRARNPGPGSQPQAGPSSDPSAPPAFSAAPARRRRSSEQQQQPSLRQLAASRRPEAPDNDEDFVRPPSFDAPREAQKSAPFIQAQEQQEQPSRPDGSSVEPVSALEHYERAVEKEAVGSLGDSLRLYRRAFRMDHRVDQTYKNKHFAAAWAPKAKQPGPAGPSAGPSASNTAATTATPAHNPLDAQPQSMKDLIASFQGMFIEPAPPEVEGAPPPPCPIADLPEEILVHVFRDVAVIDVADFVRLAQVCRRFAYLVATEERIWRRVCLGSEVGFGGMHYHWQRGVSWCPIGGEYILEDVAEGLEPVEDRRREESLATTNVLLHSAYSSSWQRMFRSRPRVRFNGCYISTVNYLRAGQASVHSTTWNSPVHIVTYYRYLRLFRDGTAISLLTTQEPADVVHHLTKDNVSLHKPGGLAHLPSAVMQSALKGRWRLSSALDNPDASPADAEGDLFVETEGVGKYTYRLELALRSAGKGARNNKLVWQRFYSYNTLTDDWAEFSLKHDKAFYFSRVRSYGAGQ